MGGLQRMLWCRRRAGPWAVLVRLAVVAAAADDHGPSAVASGGTAAATDALAAAAIKTEGEGARPKDEELGVYITGLGVGDGGLMATATASCGGGGFVASLLGVQYSTVESGRGAVALAVNAALTAAAGCAATVVGAVRAPRATPAPMAAPTTSGGMAWGEPRLFLLLSPLCRPPRRRGCTRQWLGRLPAGETRRWR